MGTSVMLKDPKGITHLLPFIDTEDSVGVIPVLADAVQLDRVPPRLAQVLTCRTGHNTQHPAHTAPALTAWTQGATGQDPLPLLHVFTSAHFK